MRTIAPASVHRPARATGAVRGQRGLSLIELMVVMVIVGIITGSAVYAVNKGPRAEDEARRLANKISEGVRLAIAGEPISPAFIANMGIDARIQMAFMIDGNGNQVMTIDRLRITPFFGMDTLSQTFMPEEVQIAGFSFAAATAPNTTPTFVLDAATPTAIYARPDGSCFAADPFNWFVKFDALTLYLESTTNPQDRVRLVVMPLGGQSVVMNGW